MAKALVLYSGSLASKAALRLAQGVPGLELRVIYFRSPFFSDPEDLGDHMYPPGGGLATKTLKREYLRIAMGGGGLPFPCGACRWVLLSRAARLLRRARLDYVITGEIVGKGGLGVGELARLDQEVGLAGRVIRPLSGGLLPRTRAEELGHWPAAALFDLTVEEPERLAALARRLGLPPGVEAQERCSLADPIYLARLKQVLEEGLPTVNTLRLLSFKHFFYFPPDLKVVVALAPEEQAELQTLFLPQDVRLYFPIPRSPLVLARADWSKRGESEREAAVLSAAQLALALAGFPVGEPCELCFRFEWEEETRRLAVTSAVPMGVDLMPAPAEVYLAG
ncbi:hypothetical protein DRJ54_00165 [Candidatus Acetothermia bacterium]|nr:MAG: hypothetical protein DRJ54_00165 [Candidatus Acetothermia bacterium]